ncbi:hypothetical protein LJY25_03010 [Hymenobacter sp. BT175]|uniref:hypothetical protein n=1 Tax=Hymenobacter translucens TaxID=2886507 RepID=UPI001D0E1217|nr:hypothetical protein [Hymenobacter translucens]MCC2545401.1 hypothetical protein [Hymenobacter translucens]
MTLLNRYFPVTVALYGLLTTLTLVVLFHGLIVLGVLPAGIVWGGRVESREQLLVLEAVSITLNLLMLAVAAVRAGLLNVRVRPVVLQIAFGLMTALFLLNTLGNMVSKNELEKAVFTPLTLLLALCCLRLTFAAGPGYSKPPVAQ